jgi:hypothetical protein
VLNTDGNSKTFFIKQILAGAFITITMTGIDQEMMQKSLSVTKLKDSQKNMVTLGFILLGVISLFLYMGGLLYLYGMSEGGQITQVIKDGLPVKDFDLLYLLASNTEKVFTRDEILEKVWGNDVVVGERTIDVHVRRLREKLGINSIQTLKGIGYKLCEVEM